MRPLKRNRINGELTIRNLRVVVEGKKILAGISFSVRAGEVHVVMGPNGSGKSTLAGALMGHPSYLSAGPVESRARGRGSIVLNGKEIANYRAEERAKAGLFLSLQSPISIAGVSVVNILRTAYQEIFAAAKPKEEKVHNPLLLRRWRAGDMTLSEFTARVKEYANLLRIESSLLNRGLNDGFSGGEKKKVEMLQALILRPKFAIFDEIDTGLDVDALRAVASAIGLLKKQGTGVIVITHYQRILRHVIPDVVHVLVGGHIVQTGNAALAKKIEAKGYTTYAAPATSH